MKRGQIPGLLALLFVCAVAFIPAMAVGAVPTTNDEATDYYNAAVQLTAQGNYTEAIALYDKALASNITMMNKTDALLYTYQGKSYSQIQLGNYSGALTTLDTGLSAFPRDEMLWNNKGFAQYNLGQYTDAVASYDRAIALDANYTGAMVNKGDALVKMGNYQDAAIAYQAALVINPVDNQTAVKLADAKNAAASSQSVILIVLAVVVIIAAAGVAYYVTRKGAAGDKTTAGTPEKTSGKKKNKK